MRDRCCHRTAKLSLGWCKNGGIQCGYHGIRFAADGAEARCGPAVRMLSPEGEEGDEGPERRRAALAEDDLAAAGWGIACCATTGLHWGYVSEPLAMYERARDTHEDGGDDADVVAGDRVEDDRGPVVVFAGLGRGVDDREARRITVMATVEIVDCTHCAVIPNG